MTTPHRGLCEPMAVRPRRPGLQPKEGNMKPFQKLLVPVDFSTHSAEAVHVATDLARRYDRNKGQGPIAIVGEYLESVIERA